MTFSNFQCVNYYLGRVKPKMSGDFLHEDGGRSGSDGAVNPSFDPSGAAVGEHDNSFSNNNYNHSVDQRAAVWKEFADRQFEEYVSVSIAIRKYLWLPFNFNLFLYCLENNLHNTLYWQNIFPFGFMVTYHTRSFFQAGLKSL